MLDDDLVEIFDCEQGSDEWWSLKVGTLTASYFSSVLSEGEGITRRNLLYRLAGEVLSKIPAESYENLAILRGKRDEPLSLADHELKRAIDITRIGFVRRTVRRFSGDFIVGCSPDGLIGDDGGIESKSMKPELIVALMEGKGHFPSQFKAQVQGNLWVTGRKWWDLKIYYESMPLSPVYRAERDEPYIEKLSNACESFLYELDKLVERLKKKGGIR